jgi:VanZ family protein
VALQKIARTAFAIAGLAIVVASLLPADELPSIDVWDKLEHAVSYAVLAALGALAYAGRGRNTAVLGVSLVVMGVVLELLQAFVPGRLTDPGDALANLIGTVVGLSAVSALSRIAGRASRLGQPGR